MRCSAHAPFEILFALAPVRQNTIQDLEELGSMAWDSDMASSGVMT